MAVTGENQPVFEIHRVGGEEAIGVNHIAFQVADVTAARKELQAYRCGAARARPDLGALTSASSRRYQPSGASFRIMLKRSKGLYGFAR